MIKNKKTLLVISAVILSLVFLAGCKPKTTGGDTTGAQSQKNQEQVSESSNYPDLYKSNQLPEYPNATLVDSGRQTTSIKDGLKLQLTSQDTVQSIATYFESEMKKLGWEVPVQKFPNEQVYNSRFTKDDLYFQMTATKFPEGETKITINFAQN